MKPLLTPQKVIVELDGTPLSTDDTYALGEIRVHQRLSLPTFCELTFFDPEGTVKDASGLEPGVSLRVYVHDRDNPLFIGQMTAIEFEYGPSGERQVYARAYDLLHQMRKRQPVRAHSQLTLKELARELVADLDLSVATTEPGPIWYKLIQHWESDLELLTETAQRCGLYYTLRGDVLHLLTLEGIGDSHHLALGDTLLETRVEINADPICRSVSATGWDPWLSEGHNGVADTPRVGRRVAAQLSPERLGGTGERTLVNRLLQHDDQALILAQSELDRRSASEITICGVADGNPLLRPGTPVEISGIAKAIAGRYVLTSVTHTIDRKKGYISQFDTAPPQPQFRQREAVTVLGCVTQIEDPEGLGRVRVSFPAIGELESDWLQVVIPGAGKEKGLIALPDLGDQVLVLLPQGNPALGVILGGLYGTEKPPDTGVEDGAVRRYTFRTPKGQRIRLDDKTKSVRLDNSGGEYVNLTPGSVRLGNSDGSYMQLSRKKLHIHSAVDLEIEAPGQAITIRGHSIDFERG